MQIAQFEYHCLRCQELFVSGTETSVAAAQKVVNQIIVGDWSFQKDMQGGMMILRQHIHRCADMGEGFGFLVGFRVKE